MDRQKKKIYKAVGGELYIGCTYSNEGQKINRGGLMKDPLYRVTSRLVYFGVDEIIFSAATTDPMNRLDFFSFFDFHNFLEDVASGLNLVSIDGDSMNGPSRCRVVRKSPRDRG